MRILIGTNLLTHIDANVYANHTALYYHLGRLSVERKWEFFQMCPTRMSIDRMRNEAGKLALQLECDYLVFIDDDMLLKTNTLESLIEADKDIVMAHTFIRGYPFKPMAFSREETGDPGDIKLVSHDSVIEDAVDGLSETYAIGFATVAIKTHLLKKLDMPWFITGPNGTEDIYFCLRCKQEIGDDVSIFTDCRVPTAHKMDPEFVSVDNVERLREYYKPKVEAEAEKRQDRGAEYHTAIQIGIGDKLEMTGT